MVDRRGRRGDRGSSSRSSGSATLGRARALDARRPAVVPETRANRASRRVGGRARAAAPAAGAPVSRNVFLELSTLGLGGVIGGLVTLPVLGFMVGPAFLKQGGKPHDLGPLTRVSRRASS